MRQDMDQETHTKLLRYLDAKPARPTLPVSQDPVLITNTRHRRRIVTQMQATECILLPQSEVLS